MFQLRYTNSVYATSDTGELDGTGERVALMLQPRHTCSWVGDIPFPFINNFYHLDRAATTSIRSSFKSSPSIHNLLQRLLRRSRPTRPNDTGGCC